MLRNDIEAYARFLVGQGAVDAEPTALIVTQFTPGQIHLGNLALQHGLLDADGLELVLEAQQVDGKLFGEKAVELGLFSRPHLEVLLRVQRYRAVLGLAEELALHGVGEFPDLLNLATAFFQERVLENDRVPAGPSQAGCAESTVSSRRF